MLLSASSTQDTKPENSHVATAVELEGSLEADEALDVLARLEAGELLLGGVKASDVGSVVLVMVESHDLLGDRGLKSLLCAIPWSDVHISSSAMG